MARKEPEFARVPLSDISTRPELFQPRDVAKGQDHDPAKVRQIIDQGWDEDVLDPIAVARDPDRPGHFVVIAGHHRYAAGRQLGVGDIPAKILDGDIDDPRDRRRLVTLADLSNYSISKPGLKEQVRTVSNLREQQYTDKDVSDRMRLTPSRVKEIGYLGNLADMTVGGGLGAIDYSTLPDNKQFLPAAVEIGRAVEEYGLSPSEAQALFTRIQRQYQETGKVPNKNALRTSLLETHRRAQERARQRTGEEAGAVGGQFGFGGAEFEESAFLGQAVDDAQVESDRLAALSKTKRNLTACETLAAELGVDISSVQQAAGTRLDQLTPEQAAQAREALATNELGGQAPPAPAPAPEMAANLFGEMQAVPQEPEEDAEPPAVAPRMAVAPPEAPVLAPTPPGPEKAPETSCPTPPTPAPAPEMAANLFGEMQAVPQEPEEDAEPPAVAPRMAVAPPEAPALPTTPPGPEKARKTVEQATMGDAFATNQNLTMALGGRPGHQMPLVDVAQEQAKQERRELVKRGQLSLGQEEKPRIVIVAVSKGIKGEIDQGRLFGKPVAVKPKKTAARTKGRKAPKDRRSQYLYGWEHTQTRGRG